MHRNEKTKIAINGFGDISKLIGRILTEGYYPNLNITRVNTKSSTIKSHVNRFNRDSTYQFHLNKYRSIASKDGDKLVITKKERLKQKTHKIHCSNQANPININWGNADLLIESSGQFRTAEAIKPHLNGAANKSIEHIILTCPPKDDSIKMFAFGVNDQAFDFSKQRIISNASCSGNCATPILKFIHDYFVIEMGNLSGIHCNTNSEYINDNYHAKEENRGRSSITNTKPITTGLGKSIFGLMPELEGIINPNIINHRVMTKGSLITFNLKVNKKISKDIFVNALENYEYFENGIISLDYDHMTSIDVIGNSSSSVISVPTIEVWNNTISFTAFYDNRMGYSHRVCELAKAIQKDKALNAHKYKGEAFHNNI